MNSHEFRFDNGRGQTLAGRLELPLEVPRHFALFAHCFTCGKDIAAAGRVSRALARVGIAVLRFDFTGLGSSEGDFANENFSSNVQDLVAAATALRERHRAPSLLVGHSLGGAAVLAGAAEIAEAQGVVTIGAPADPAHVRRLISGNAALVDEHGRAEVVLGGRTFTIERQFLEDLEQQQQQQQIRKLGKALLIFHAPGDDVVGIDEARRIFDRAMHPKSFVSLDGADHLLSRKQDAEYVGEVIAAWAGRYLNSEDQGLASVDGVRVETLTGNFTQRVSTGRHRLLADEPERMGGDDLGPGPYEYLLAALGSCTSMTMAMYARRKGWPLERVSIDLSHDRIHAADCDDCEEERSGRIERLTRRMRIEGPLDDTQRQRLLEIADKCPVHKTLLSHPHISTRMDTDGE